MEGLCVSVPLDPSEHVKWMEAGILPVQAGQPKGAVGSGVVGGPM